MNKKIITLFILFFAIIFQFSFASIDRYCATPPFLTSNIKPNILFVVDVSGSMKWSAYNPNENSKYWCADPDGCGWTFHGNEEGYFIPDKNYELIGDCDSNNYSECYWQETSKDTVSNCPNVWSEVYDNHGVYTGACLNFLLMSRIDLLRWAITGGRPEDCDNDEYTDSACDPNIACSGDTCTLKTHYGDRVIVPIERIKGILQIFETQKNRPRFGVLFYGGSIRKPKVYIGDYPYTSGSDAGNADSTRPYTYIKRFINAISPDNATPTAPAMWEAYDYFKQSNDHNYSNGFSLEEGTYKDPNYFCDANKQNCTPVPCAKNFVILASDGQWNVGGASPPKDSCKIDDDGYENYSPDPVVPAYRMHKDILRTITSVSGNQYDINVHGVYALGLFLGGTGEQSLKNVAVYGSFDTQLYDWPSGTDGSHWNGDGAHYPWETCDMDDCGEGRGSACTPLPPSSPDWDKDGDGVPDTFLNAKNAVEIKESLLKFIRDIMRKAYSGTSVSVLTERDKKGAIVAQALFYPQSSFGNKYVTWTGHLYTYWFFNSKLAQNIREDTVSDKKLNVLEDKILNFYIDVIGNLKIDTCVSDSTGNSTGDCETKELKDISYIWDAGKELLDTEPEERNIFVYCDKEAGCNSVSKLVPFDTEHLEVFERYLGFDINEFPDCLGSDLTERKRNLVNYVLGNDVNGCRNRTTDNDKVWKLGDIIYSTPKIVYYEDYGVIFTASNDGILHAFKLGKLENVNLGNDIVKLTGDELGKELWGFIPRNALPYLRYLADPDYCHIYIHDLSPYIINADYNNDGKLEVVLIGGMRLGGGCGCTPNSSDCVNKPTEDCCINPPTDVCSDPDNDSCIGRSVYYALDVTDPLNPKALWEFTHKDLGYSFSGPAYVKRLDNNGVMHHFVLFASGPTTYDGFSSQPLRIFVLNLQDGNLLYIAGEDNSSDLSSLNNAFGGKLFTNGLDINEDGQTDYVLLGYVRNTDPHTSDGGIVKIWTGGVDPSEWDYDTETLNFAKSPITAKIEANKCFNNWYIFFGTGRFFYKTDDLSAVNALYGIPFPCDANNNCAVGTINPVHVGYGGGDTKQELACGDIGDPTKGGWVIELDDKTEIYLKERNIASPSIVKNIVFFATTQPSSDICGFGGVSRAWAMNCATGDAITSDRCPGYTIEVSRIKYLLQLSGGDIQQYGKLDFTEEGGRATVKTQGITSEEGGVPVIPGGIKGEILLWIEK